jgi:hypothetical protein
MMEAAAAVVFVGSKREADDAVETEEMDWDCLEGGTLEERLLEEEAGREESAGLFFFAGGVATQRPAMPGKMSAKGSAWDA